jgi:L-lactate dehydrogenase complex protein LldG
MNNARQHILQRIDAALRDVPKTEVPEDVAVPRNYQSSDNRPHAQQVAHFVETTADYKATVHHIGEADLAARIAQSCAAHGVKRLVLPTDMPQSWLAQLQDVELLPDNELTIDDLEASDGVLTGCALGIAQTGTIVLDAGPRQGRRIITLLPDYHLCVVFASQVVGILPEAIAALHETVYSTGRPLTFISGPSATSDIELNRVEGVHGPRTLEVLVVEG